MVYIKMKSIIPFFFLVSLVLSCQTKTKDKVEVQINEPIKDTIIPIKKDTLNISKPFVLGKFDYRTDSTFVKVSAAYSSRTIYLNQEAYRAFLDMSEAAVKEGVSFKIISGTRNFYEQKAIWERKWERYNELNSVPRALKILEYSSMPSTSRHHWGTDIDLNSLNNSYFNTGKGLKEYQWLTSHANDFGFYQVYTDKSNGRTGYQMEKWHWSYLPLASQYLSYYNTNIDVNDINGFKGSDLAKQLLIIEDYVNGISEKALNYK